METFKDGILKISVRSLVEFVLRSGDIDNRTFSGTDVNAMQEGARLHIKIQGKMGGNYHAEVPLRMEFPFDDFTIMVEGRADGIIDGDDEKSATIDEIKCVYTDLLFIEEPRLLHKAQAMCYGYFYGVQNNLETVNIQLTGDGNRATVTVYPNFNSNNLTLTGRLVPYDQSNVFQGQTI